MALFPDPFDTLPSLQQALDAFRASSWLGASSSGGGSFPPLTHQSAIKATKCLYFPAKPCIMRHEARRPQL
jgi:hypothetical protein